MPAGDCTQRALELTCGGAAGLSAALGRAHPSPPVCRRRVTVLSQTGVLLARTGHRRRPSMVRTTTHEFEQQVETEWLRQQRIDLQVRRDVFRQSGANEDDRRSGPRRAIL